MVNSVDIIKEILTLSIFCAGRHSKFNVDIPKHTDDKGDRIVLWCRPGEREEDGYCIVRDQTINCSQLYCLRHQKGM
ncbi:unnamed protein product [Ixodes persulcatus]